MIDTKNNTNSSESDPIQNEKEATNPSEGEVINQSKAGTETGKELNSSDQDKDNNNSESSDKKSETKDAESEVKEKEENKENKEEVDFDYSKLTFKDPENIDQDLLKEATEIFGESKISVEQAQKIVQLQEKASQKAILAYQNTVEGWIKESKSDPEIGGKDFEKNKAAANLAFKTYGSESLGKFLDDYRFGDHPEVVKMFARIGKTLKEDPHAASGMGKKPSSDGKTLAERMYPSNRSDGQF